MAFPSNSTDPVTARKNAQRQSAMDAIRGASAPAAPSAPPSMDADNDPSLDAGSPEPGSGVFTCPKCGASSKFQSTDDSAPKENPDETNPYGSSSPSDAAGSPQSM